MDIFDGLKITQHYVGWGPTIIDEPVCTLRLQTKIVIPLGEDE